MRDHRVSGVFFNFSLRIMKRAMPRLRDATNSIIFPIWPPHIRPHISTFKLGSCNCSSWKLLAVINMTCQNVASCAVLAMRLGIYRAKLRPIITENVITILRFTTNLSQKPRSPLVVWLITKKINLRRGKKIIISRVHLFFTSQLCENKYVQAFKIFIIAQ
jgi:hypothetical protein